MDAGQVRVSFEMRGSACLMRVSGELTLVTEREFTATAAAAAAAFPGSILLDLSGVIFVDRHGARALIRVLSPVPPRQTGLHGCSSAVWRILTVLGFVLPQEPAPVRAVQASPPLAGAGARSRGEILTALGRASEASARQSAAYGSEVMSRLASTYAELALNSRYRMGGKSADRGQLLALSGHALDLSRQYMRHAAGGAECENSTPTSRGRARRPGEPDPARR